MKLAPQAAVPRRRHGHLNLRRSNHVLRQARRLLQGLTTCQTRLPPLIRHGGPFTVIGPRLLRPFEPHDRQPYYLLLHRRTLLHLPLLQR
jgi:hypothetical protein